jgi:SNF2 family DNA or RNA helicase
VSQLPAVAGLSAERRAQIAERIRQMPDFELPDLAWFNSEPCQAHAPDPYPQCLRCGVRLRKHQRVAAAWWYAGRPAMLSDIMGLGKTATALAWLAMLKQSGELGPGNRAVIVTRSAAVRPVWETELRRLTPGLKVIIADGAPAERLNAYMGDWEVAVLSDRTLSAARGRKQSRDGDVAVLEQMPVGILAYDDLDALRNDATETSKAVMRLAARCSRVIGMHATPAQKQLAELWCQLQPVGAAEVLGSLQLFESQYALPVRRMVSVPLKTDPTGRLRENRWVYIENDLVTDPAVAARFRARIRPLTLRRTADDVDDVAMPAVQYGPRFLDLAYPQRQRYRELREGTVRLLTAGGVKITQAQAMARFMRGQQICSGLAALDGPDGDVSAKLDQVMADLTGDLPGEKAVVFVAFKPNVAALSARLKAAGIRHVLMWGAETNPKERARRLTAFREDPECRVLVGTATIEASLNLQIARYMLLVDTIPNPARMAQLIGRCARQGSPFPTVYVRHYLARGTQEEAYLAMLRREALMADVVWDEASSIFTALTPRQIVQLVAYGTLVPD